MVTILVVEDDFLNRELLAEQMDGKATVETATDGEHALIKLRGLKPDLLVIDLNMPRMNGFDLLKTLRDRGDDTPVVVITAMDLRTADYDFFRQHRVSRVFEKGRSSVEEVTQTLLTVAAGR